MKGKKKILRYILITLLVLVVAMVAAGYGALKYYHSLLDYQPEDVPDTTVDFVEDETDEETVAPPISDDVLESIEEEMQENLENNKEVETEKGMYNLLLVGVDSRENNFSGRSDTMILLTINQNTKKILATSFLRDTFVTIPGKGTNRLNAAYAYGGISLLKETIQANYGIPVDKCAVVNFSLVQDFVDAVGGVEIEVSNEEITVMNNYIEEQNRLQGKNPNADKIPEGGGGFLHLNGQQAVGFARIRYVGNYDFGRTERQREVLAQCFAKMKGLGLGQLNDLVHQFFPKVRTDLSETDCAYLLTLLFKIKDYKMETMSLPVDGSWSYATIRGMSVISVDFGMNAVAWTEKVNAAN